MTRAEWDAKRDEIADRLRADGMDAAVASTYASTAMVVAVGSPPESPPPTFSLAGVGVEPSQSPFGVALSLNAGQDVAIVTPGEADAIKRAIGAVAAYVRRSGGEPSG